ncbi:hypothetical protein [Arthrobacter sp. HMWF013]|uniref:hypothetical protein n=1 Tax=Arthrobacter sp. HMWF013 TaxID=2056849 RepID=UPI000D4FD340|nr:hypothetical protein [Arthrobacter sp. HMWF013]PTT70197.1 hypothetical protein DBR22_01895 [Arthrobacter sp. HMWF013]
MLRSQAQHPGGEVVELRIFGEEEDTIAFTDGLAFHDSLGQRYGPPYRLPALHQGSRCPVSHECLIDVADAAKKCEPERVDPNRVEHKSYVVSMSMALYSD